MHFKKFASSIADLKVGMRVRHDGDLDAGTEGVITPINVQSAGGGEVKVLTDDNKADGYTRGRGFYFDGYNSGRNRKWEILHDPSVPDPSEVGVGDEIEIVTTVKGVVQRVTYTDGGEVKVYIKGAPFSAYTLAEKPHSNAPSTRTWAVTAKFVPPPPPWQAGDIAKSDTHVGIRQADGTWADLHGGRMSWTDATVETNEYIRTVVRGGVKQP